MADRGPVKIRQGAINNLIDIYKRTYVKLIKEIQDATTAGRINSARVMARINRELKDLGVDVSAWVKKEIPQYYLDGANAAIQDLKGLGLDMQNTKNQAVINREAMQALVDDVNASFADSITYLSRNSRKYVNQTVRRQLNAVLAQGKLTGDTRLAISALVEKELKEQGIGVLVDKSGREWAFDHYSEMLVRTKAVEARNQGLANRMLQNNYDLVQVTDHGSEHPACAKWEGKILSLTGQTTGRLPGGFVVAGTVEQATSEGLFHPNCEHAINVLIPSLAEKTDAYDAEATMAARKKDMNAEPIYKKAF